MSNDYQMPRRNDACAGCGHVFEIGEQLEAFLYEARDGYERRDYCPNCDPPPEPQPLGFWKTQRPAPPARKTRPFDRAAIYALFQGLADSAQPERIRLRFVLALLLWRKRVLKFERAARSDAGELWHFSVPRTDETHRVARPDLDEEQIERLSAQLEQLLAGEPGQAEHRAAESAADLVASDADKGERDG